MKPYAHRTQHGSISVGILVLFALLCHALLATVQGAAVRHKSKRVVGGDALELGAWPWLVSLNYLEKHAYLELQGLRHLCGGTLLTPQWVLTAAHCVHFASGSAALGEPQNWRAVLGEYNRKVTEATEQVIGLESIHVHPEYSLDPQLTKDIALLHLERPATLNDVVQPIGLDVDRELVPGSHCEAAGWGQHTSDEDDQIQYGNGTYLPHVVTVQCVSQQICGLAYDRLWPRIDQNVVCFNSDNKKDTCKGDSGGPLVCYNPVMGEAVLSGIVSVGMGCALQDYPGIYTRVSSFREWILHTINTYTQPSVENSSTNHVYTPPEEIVLEQLQQAAAQQHPQNA